MSPIPSVWVHPRITTSCYCSGTGLRNADSSTVTVTFNGTAGVVKYAGAQGTFVGLDQVNVVIPQNAGLHGDVVVALTAAGLAANPVHLTFE